MFLCDIQQRVNILVNNQSSTCLGHLIEPQNGNYIGDVPIPSHSRWNILKMRCKCVLINSGEKLLSHNKRTTTSPSSSYQEDDDLLLLVRCLPTDLMTDLAITETIFHLIIKYRAVLPPPLLCLSIALLKIHLLYSLKCNFET